MLFFKIQINKYVTVGGEEKQPETKNLQHILFSKQRDPTQKGVFSSFFIKNKTFYYAVHSTSHFNSKMEFSFATNGQYSLLKNDHVTNNI